MSALFRAIVCFSAWLALGGLAQRDFSAVTDVQLRDGFVRFIISTADAIEFDATLIETDLFIDFDRPLSGDFSMPVALAPDYFLAARHGDTGSALHFSVPYGVRLHTSQSMNVIAIDLLHPSFQGDPRNIISHRELARDRAINYFAALAPSIKPQKTQKLPEDIPLLAVVGHAATMPMQEPSRPDNKKADFNPVPQLEYWRARAKAKGFVSIEQSLLIQLAESSAVDKPLNKMDLAYFYFAHGLYPEAAAILNERGENSAANAHAELLTAISEIRMGRMRGAKNRLASTSLRSMPEAAAWRALANARLGTFKTASEDFETEATPPSLVEADVANYYLAMAQTGVAVDNIALAENALKQLRGHPVNQSQRAERRLLESKILFSRGRVAAGYDLLTRLSEQEMDPFSVQAKLAIIERRQRVGELSAQSALSRVDKLLMNWRGGDFERDALSLRAHLLDQVGDIGGAFEARRLLVEKFPLADISKTATVTMTAQLQSMFDDGVASPLVAAKVFYRNIDLAPPGREGDVLIRDVVQKLIDLDLLDAASELLHHQVFERLRGAERTAKAADLAALYLQNEQPGRALATLRDTRRTRMSEGLAARRQILEAQALFNANDSVAALAILEDRTDTKSLSLRGDILWSTGDWLAAGNAYAAALSAEESASSFSPAESKTALVAMSAFALAGAAAEQNAFYSKIEGKIDDPLVGILIENLVRGDFTGEPSHFLSAYRDYFHRAETAL